MSAVSCTKVMLWQGDSVLKAQYMTEEMKKYRPTGPTQQELMKIFHTTRHVFDPKFVVHVPADNVGYMITVMNALEFVRLNQ